mmetsp:Transcript_3511/g.8435  ORF Transcript_3511/g.8435 Transcript_3511/m.8435 type:complete len:340 (-) Transcript_3511:684-1703(-)
MFVWMAAITRISARPASGCAPCWLWSEPSTFSTSCSSWSCATKYAAAHLYANLSDASISVSACFFFTNCTQYTTPDIRPITPPMIPTMPTPIRPVPITNAAAMAEMPIIRRLRPPRRTLMLVIQPCLISYRCKFRNVSTAPLKAGRKAGSLTLGGSLSHPPCGSTPAGITGRWLVAAASLSPRVQIAQKLRAAAKISHRPLMQKARPAQKPMNAPTPTKPAIPAQGREAPSRADSCAMPSPVSVPCRISPVPKSPIVSSQSPAREYCRPAARHTAAREINFLQSNPNFTHTAVRRTMDTRFAASRLPAPSAFTPLKPLKKFAVAIHVNRSPCCATITHE